MYSSNASSTLVKMYNDQEESKITPPGEGIDLALAIRDMLHIGIHSADLYDNRYLDAVGADKLISMANEDPGGLTVNDLNFLANTLGSTLFIHFIARQLDTGQTEAWDVGVSHALEIRSKLEKLFNLTDILTDNPLGGKVIGQAT